MTSLLDDADDFNRSENASKPFLCSYRFDGRMWSIIVYASTYEEAEMKLRSIGNGTVDGILAGEIE